ncbi:MAG: GGDEF domain-containing protein [Treponema sp.]|nr:GGDEF domain-containing protein [Treponema sp.]
MNKCLKTVAAVMLLCIRLPVYAQVKDTPHKKITIGYFSDNVFHVGQKDGERKSGYGYEYYQELAKYTDWDYEYVYGSWNDVYKKFVRGEIDILDAVSKNADREKYMLFSEKAMGVDNYYIFTTADNSSINEYDLSTLHGKKIGVNENSTSQLFLEKFIKENNLDAEIILCEGYVQRMAFLLTGEIDAIVATDALNAENLRAVKRIASENIYFAVNSSKPELMEELNLAQEKLLLRKPGYEVTLRNKYFNKAAVKNGLDFEEKIWIKNHPVLKVGYMTTSMPFCGQNKDTGEMTGLLFDVLRSLEKYLGIHFEAIPFSSNNHMATAVREGIIDLSFPVADDMWFSEKNGYINTMPITQNRFSLVFSGDYKGDTGYPRIAYVPGSPAQEVVLERFKFLDKAIPYENLNTLFMGLSKGEVDCSILNADVANYAIRNDVRFKNLQSAHLDEYVGYSFGMARDNILLYSVMELGISRLNSGMINESLNRYSQVSPDISVRIFWLKYKSHVMSALIILLCLILIIVLVYNHSLNKEKRKVIAAREKALKAATDARTDPLTGARNRRSFYEVLEDFNNAGKQFVVGFIDVDDFKEFNNKYGHETGDQVLRFIVKALNYSFPNSFIGRFGGDEFVIISEQSVDIVKKQSEEFLHLISDGISIRETGLRVPVGSSVGLVQVTRQVSDIRDIQNQADIAMYHAKKMGKNQVHVGI